MKTKYLFFSLLAVFHININSQNLYQAEEEIFLYERINEQIKEKHVKDDAFGLLVNNVTNPTITPFIPNDDNNKKSAIIICPGGGYHTLLLEKEGFRIAKKFNKNGVAAFVLKYRLPNLDSIEDKSFAPLKDAQRAIQLIRENADKWGINASKIGVMGFSAGGHLAASLGVHYDSVLIENKQETDLRPDFMILINPVISFNDDIGHVGSKQNLLGVSPDTKSIDFFSNELHINSFTPKSILVHTDDDSVVPMEHSLCFYKELHKNKIPTELHIYSKGDHGFIHIPEIKEWFNRCIRWMKIEDLL